MSGNYYNKHQVAKSHTNKKPFGQKSVASTLVESVQGKYLFSGESPILYVAAKIAITSYFSKKDVYDMVHYQPGTAVDDLQENTFEDVMPTHQVNVTDKAIADRDVIGHLYVAEQAAVLASQGYQAAGRHIEMTRLNLEHMRALAKINMDETGATLTAYQNERKRWEDRRKLHLKKCSDTIECFDHCFSPTCLSTVRVLIQNQQFRRAWFELNEKYTAAGSGQGNALIMLAELSGMQFDARKTSFVQLMAELNVIYQQLDAMGMEPESENRRFTTLLEILGKSPGQEYATALSYIKLSRGTPAQGLTILEQAAGEMASINTLTHTPNSHQNGVHLNLMAKGGRGSGGGGGGGRGGRGGRGGGGRGGGNANYGSSMTCYNCGKPGHSSRECRGRRQCFNCKSYDHTKQDCPNQQGGGSSNRPLGNVTTNSSEGVGSVGNRFANAKKSDVYSEALTYEAVTLNSNVAIQSYFASSTATDHRIGTLVANLLRLWGSEIGSQLYWIKIILDSGASHHMLPVELLISYTQMLQGGTVRLGDGTNRLQIAGLGDTRITEINDVIHVPDLSIGVLSISQFDLQGFITIIDSGRATVYDRDDRVILTATMDDTMLYVLDAEYVKLLYGLYDVTANPTYGVDGSMKSVHTTMDFSSDGDDQNGRDVHVGLTESESLVTGEVLSDQVNMINTDDTSTNALLSSTSVNTGFGLNPLEILHRQWGHMHPTRIKEVLQKQLVKNCKYSYKQVKDLDMPLCKQCLEGNMRAVSEKPTTDHTWDKLEKIAVDYKGDFPRRSHGGYRGFFLLVDYKTNYLYAGMVASKSEHTRVLQNYMIKVVMANNCKWKVLQSDSESIFKSKRVANWLRKHYIALQLSTPYQHWQNGQVEVYVGHVMNRARTLMQSYNVPTKYWNFAVLYAIYTMNRMPNASTGISAVEALTGDIPDVSKLVPFYAPGVFHLTSDERKGPWDNKAKPCRMLGYADGYARAYTIMSVVSGKVIVRENCIFDIADMDPSVEDIEEDRGIDRDDLVEYDRLLEDSEDEDDTSTVDSNIEEVELEPVNTDQDTTDQEDDTDEQYLNQSRLDTYMTLLDVWHNDMVQLLSVTALALPPNPKTVDEALASAHGEQWRKAITKELDGFILRDTFGDAEQEGYGMKTKLILYYKYDSAYNIVCKARLVVCGYSQRKGIDYHETYSPTTTNPIVLMLLCIAGLRDCKVASFDVSAAFLEGRADTQMFAWLPAEIDSTNTKRRVEILGNWYGAKQAGKIWNELLDNILCGIGFIRCADMPCLYSWKYGNDWMYCTVHVDDGMIICNDVSLVTELVTRMMEHLHKVEATEHLQLYLGMDIERSVDGRYFQVSQERYVKTKFKGYDRVYHTPMATGINLRVTEPNMNNRSLLPDTGTMRYLADRSRPDILVALGEASTGGGESPSDQHVAVIERIKHYLSYTCDAAIHVGGTTPVQLFGYCDAAYVNTGNCKSRLGSCLFMNEDSGAISCVSRNDTTVSHSSTEAEIKALDMLVREVVYFRKILEFMGYEQLQPSRIYCDNKSAIELCKILKVNHKVKHINVRIQYIREQINARVIEIVFVSTDLNVADVLTKALAREAHERHTDVLLHGHMKYLQSGVISFNTMEFYWNQVCLNEDIVEEMKLMDID